MERIPEQDLMINEANARAYAEADFSEAHDAFVADYRAVFGDDNEERFVLDLGCGPCDVVIRLCRSFPRWRVHGVDGSLAMLQQARRALDKIPEIAWRVELIHGVFGGLQGAALPRQTYDVIVSNSLLHHLHDASVMWETIWRYAAYKTRIYIVDLLRPISTAGARQIVQRYAAGEPDILKQDFYNSLLAAYTLDEIVWQLHRAGLGYFSVRQISVCHAAISAEMTHR